MLARTLLQSPSKQSRVKHDGNPRGFATIRELMPLDTLWESICRLAGDDGKGSVRLEDAVHRSAVPQKVARVEVRRMIEDGLIDGDEEMVQLTERGRRSCFEVNQAPGDNGVIAPK
jgi:hypothetical protein